VGREDFMRVMPLWDVGTWVLMRRRIRVLLLLLIGTVQYTVAETDVTGSYTLPPAILLHEAKSRGVPTVTAPGVKEITVCTVHRFMACTAVCSSQLLSTAVYTLQTRPR
jgi:hypothetical protein